MWRERVEFTNGHTRDHNGDLLHCSHGLRAVFRTRWDGGDQRIVVDRWQGKRFNAPNDIVVKSDGTIWFTDPPYGLVIPEEGRGGESEIGDCYVFRFDPRDGALEPVTDLPERAERARLLAGRIVPLRVGHVGGAAPRWPAATIASLRSTCPGGPACLRTTACSPSSSQGSPTAFASTTMAGSTPASLDSVQVYDAAGIRLAKIHVPEKVGNVTFGGPQRDSLFVAASTSLYRIRLATRGIQGP